MSGKVFLISLSFLLIFSFKRYTPGSPSLKSILSAYDARRPLFNTPNNSPAKDSACMEGFRKVISELSSLPGQNLLTAFFIRRIINWESCVTYIKIITKATCSYLQAMKYSSDPGEKFSLNVLAGSGYYNLNNFDSASFFLLQAEEMQVKGVPLRIVYDFIIPWVFCIMTMETTCRVKIILPRLFAD